MDYFKIYDTLIERGRKRSLGDCYYEVHHIIPRCMGGSDRGDNLVRLTPEEHFVAHQLLVKMYPKNGKLIYAARAMTLEAPTHGGRRSKNKMYGWLQRRFSAQRKKEVARRRTKKRFCPKAVKQLAAHLAAKKSGT